MSKPTGRLVAWTDIKATTEEGQEFWLNPYVPCGGITFLWGDTSIGKSPLTWAMAGAIGAGTPFFGLPTKAGRVLYIEVDTPFGSLRPRLVKIPPAPNVWWLVRDPFSIPYVSGPEKDAIVEARETAKPDVVFVNTLRKVHDLDDRESRTTKIVYTFFREAFPGASMVFVHHLRKRPTDPRALSHDKEGFSGAKNWINDAQVGLQLESQGRTAEGLSLLLYLRKTQVGEEMRPLGLILGPDGSTLRCPLAEKLEATKNALDRLGPTSAASMRTLDAALAALIGVSPATARRRRLFLEEGFPGVGFLRQHAETDGALTDE